MKKKLQIAVRALVEHVLRSGDLNLTFTGAGRTTEAIRAHQKIQKSRPAGYTSEFPIRHEIETKNFLLEISGRIDGVYMKKINSAETDDGIIPIMVDEIKTTTIDLDHYKNKDNPIHWGQAKIYAYMILAAYDLPEIDVQLTYYQLDTGKQMEIHRHFTGQTLREFFNDLITKYLTWASVLSAWHSTRNEAIDAFSFPFPTYRTGQRDMAVQVYRTIKNNAQCLVQAPTGIGKTMAALFPTIKALGLGLIEKVFYLTARTTARSVVEKATAIMGQKGLRIKSLTLTAKDKICFNPEAACNAEECPHAKGHFDRIDEAVSDIFSHQDRLTREVVEQIAQTYRVCPFEFSLELALHADLIICDYNYAFDPRVYLRRFFLDNTGDYTFLVDEAHNLVDRSRDMFSAEIQKQPLLDLRRRIKKDLPGLHKTLGKINVQLVKLKKACDSGSGRITTPAPPSALSSLLAAFHHQAERWLANNIPLPFREELLDLFFTVGAFLRILEGYDDNYVTCIEKTEKDLRVKLFCMNPAGPMKEALTRCQSALFFSATLTPANYFKHLFGCHDTALAVSLPSPFPPENFCLLTAPNISTRYKNRVNSLPALIRTLHALVTGIPGHQLLFFPSYQYMAMAHEAFSKQYSDIHVIVQTQGMTEEEREIFLSKFSQDNTRRMVGFAVMGGIFGEGIDLEGNRLSGAVIVGVGLPGISMENELIRDYFNKTENAGFEYAYQYPGINRVLQAAGRVIRSETDRGAVLLIDERYATARYRSLLPPHWRPGRVNRASDLTQTLEGFFGTFQLSLS